MNNSYGFDFNNHDSFLKYVNDNQLNKPSALRSLCVNDKGTIYSANMFRTGWEKFKGFFGGFNHTNKNLVEYRVIEFIAAAANLEECLNKEDLDLILEIAKRAGLIIENNDSRKEHEELNNLINLISTKIFVNKEKNVPLENTKNIIKDYVRYHKAESKELRYFRTREKEKSQSEKEIKTQVEHDTVIDVEKEKERETQEKESKTKQPEQESQQTTEAETTTPAAITTPAPIEKEEPEKGAEKKEAQEPSKETVEAKQEEPAVVAKQEEPAPTVTPPQVQEPVGEKPEPEKVEEEAKEKQEEELAGKAQEEQQQLPEDNIQAPIQEPKIPPEPTSIPTTQPTFTNVHETEEEEEKVQDQEKEKETKGGLDLEQGEQQKEEKPAEQYKQQQQPIPSILITPPETEKLINDIKEFSSTSTVPKATEELSEIETPTPATNVSTETTITPEVTTVESLLEKMNKTVDTIDFIDILSKVPLIETEIAPFKTDGQEITILENPTPDYIRRTYFALTGEDIDSKTNNDPVKKFLFKFLLISGSDRNPEIIQKKLIDKLSKLDYENSLALLITTYRLLNYIRFKNSDSPDDIEILDSYKSLIADKLQSLAIVNENEFKNLNVNKLGELHFDFAKVPEEFKTQLTPIVISSQEIIENVQQPANKESTSWSTITKVVVVGGVILGSIFAVPFLAPVIGGLIGTGANEKPPTFGPELEPASQVNVVYNFPSITQTTPITTVPVFGPEAYKQNHVEQILQLKQIAKNQGDADRLQQTLKDYGEAQRSLHHKKLTVIKGRTYAFESITEEQANLIAEAFAVNIQNNLLEDKEYLQSLVNEELKIYALEPFEVEPPEATESNQISIHVSEQMEKDIEHKANMYFVGQELNRFLEDKQLEHQAQKEAKEPSIVTSPKTDTTSKKPEPTTTAGSSTSQNTTSEGVTSSLLGIAGLVTLASALFLGTRSSKTEAIEEEKEVEVAQPEKPRIKTLSKRKKDEKQKLEEKAAQEAKELAEQEQTEAERQKRSANAGDGQEVSFEDVKFISNIYTDKGLSLYQNQQKLTKKERKATLDKLNKVMLNENTLYRKYEINEQYWTKDNGGKIVKIEDVSGFVYDKELYFSSPLDSTIAISDEYFIVCNDEKPVTIRVYEFPKGSKNQIERIINNFKIVEHFTKLQEYETVTQHTENKLSDLRIEEEITIHPRLLNKYGQILKVKGLNSDEGEEAFYLLKAQADKGNFDAMVLVSEIILDNPGFENYREQAFEYVRRLSIENAFAANWLGSLYENGIGVDQDKEIAFNCYQNSAAQGYAPAKFNVALCYKDGFGVEQNPNEAFKLFKELAENGFEDAIPELINCYKYGFGTPVNNDEAQDWEFFIEKMNKEIALKIKNKEKLTEIVNEFKIVFDEIVNQINTEADQLDTIKYDTLLKELNNSILDLENSIDHLDTIKSKNELKELIELPTQNIVKQIEDLKTNLINDKINNLIEILYSNKKESEIFQAAYKLLRKFAQEGKKNAMILLCMYFIDNPLEHELLANIWAKKLVKENAPEGSNMLAGLKLFGIGCEPDINEAYSIFEKITKDNHYPPALHNLALCQLYGLGVEKNEQLAIQNLKELADEGLIESIEVLACYENGIGTDKRPEKAKYVKEKIQKEKARSSEYNNKKHHYYLNQRNLERLISIEQAELVEGKGKEKIEQKSKDAVDQKRLDDMNFEAHRFAEDLYTYDVIKQKSALSKLANLADQGDEYAKVVLCNYYFNNENKAMADLVFRYATELDRAENPEGTNLLASCYLAGFGVEQNLHKAFNLYTDANYKSGFLEVYPPAIYNTALCYLQGLGINKNTKEAIKLLTELANDDNREAIKTLAQLYEEGIEVEVDLIKSKGFLSKLKNLEVEEDFNAIDNINTHNYLTDDMVQLIANIPIIIETSPITKNSIEDHLREEIENLINEKEMKIKFILDLLEEEEKIKFLEEHPSPIKELIQILKKLKNNIREFSETELIKIENTINKLINNAKETLNQHLDLATLLKESQEIRLEEEKNIVKSEKELKQSGLYEDLATKKKREEREKLQVIAEEKAGLEQEEKIKLNLTVGQKIKYSDLSDFILKASTARPSKHIKVSKKENRNLGGKVNHITTISNKLSKTEYSENNFRKFEIEGIESIDKVPGFKKEKGSIVFETESEGYVDITDDSIIICNNIDNPLNDLKIWVYTLPKGEGKKLQNLFDRGNFKITVKEEPLPKQKEKVSDKEVKEEKVVNVNDIYVQLDNILKSLKIEEKIGIKETTEEAKLKEALQKKEVELEESLKDIHNLISEMGHEKEVEKGKEKEIEKEKELEEKRRYEENLQNEISSLQKKLNNYTEFLKNNSDDDLSKLVSNYSSIIDNLNHVLNSIKGQNESDFKESNSTDLIGQLINKAEEINKEISKLRIQILGMSFANDFQKQLEDLKISQFVSENPSFKEKLENKEISAKIENLKQSSSSTELEKLYKEIDDFIENVKEEYETQKNQIEKEKSVKDANDKLEVLKQIIFQFETENPSSKGKVETKEISVKIEVLKKAKSNEEIKKLTNEIDVLISNVANKYETLKKEVEKENAEKEDAKFAKLIAEEKKEAAEKEFIKFRDKTSEDLQSDLKKLEHKILEFENNPSLNDLVGKYNNITKEISEKIKSINLAKSKEEIDNLYNEINSLIKETSNIYLSLKSKVEEEEEEKAAAAAEQKHIDNKVNASMEGLEEAVKSLPDDYGPNPKPEELKSIKKEVRKSEKHKTLLIQITNFKQLLEDNKTKLGDNKNEFFDRISKLEGRTKNLKTKSVDYQNKLESIVIDYLALVDAIQKFLDTQKEKPKAQVLKEEIEHESSAEEFVEAYKEQAENKLQKTFFGIDEKIDKIKQDIKEELQKNLEGFEVIEEDELPEFNRLVAEKLIDENLFSFAIKYLEKAANKDAKAAFNLAMIYLQGYYEKSGFGEEDFKLNTDPIKARDYLHIAFNNGDNELCTQIGLRLKNLNISQKILVLTEESKEAKTNLTKPFYWFDKAAKKGYAPAIKELAILYQNCQVPGTEKVQPKDIEGVNTILSQKTEELIDQLIKTDDAHEIFDLGLLYEQHFSVGSQWLDSLDSQVQPFGNYERARKLYEKAAELNHPFAIARLAVMNQVGLGGKQNLSAANELFDRLEKLKEEKEKIAEAYFQIGEMFRDPWLYQRGVNLSRLDIPTLAQEYHIKAKELGSQKSEIIIGGWDEEYRPLPNPTWNFINFMKSSLSLIDSTPPPVPPRSTLMDSLILETSSQKSSSLGSKILFEEGITTSVVPPPPPSAPPPPPPISFNPPALVIHKKEKETTEKEVSKEEKSANEHIDLNAVLKEAFRKKNMGEKTKAKVDTNKSLSEDLTASVSDDDELNSSLFKESLGSETFEKEKEKGKEKEIEKPSLSAFTSEELSNIAHNYVSTSTNTNINKNEFKAASQSSLAEFKDVLCQIAVNELIGEPISAELSGHNDRIRDNLNRFIKALKHLPGELRIGNNLIEEMVRKNDVDPQKIALLSLDFQPNNNRLQKLKNLGYEAGIRKKALEDAITSVVQLNGQENVGKGVSVIEELNKMTLFMNDAINALEDCARAVLECENTYGQIAIKLYNIKTQKIERENASEAYRRAKENFEYIINIFNDFEEIAKRAYVAALKANPNGEMIDGDLTSAMKKQEDRIKDFGIKLENKATEKLDKEKLEKEIDNLMEELKSLDEKTTEGRKRGEEILALVRVRRDMLNEIQTAEEIDAEDGDEWD